MKPFVAFTDDTILEGATPQELQEEWTRAPSLVETPPAPITEGLKDTQVWELGIPPIPWATEEPTDEPAPTEEATVKLAILMGTVEELAKEPDTPYAVWEGRKEESST